MKRYYPLVLGLGLALVATTIVACEEVTPDGSPPESASEEALGQLSDADQVTLDVYNKFAKEHNIEPLTKWEMSFLSRDEVVKGMFWVRLHTKVEPPLSELETKQ